MADSAGKTSGTSTSVSLYGHGNGMTSTTKFTDIVEIIFPDCRVSWQNVKVIEAEHAIHIFRLDVEIAVIPWRLMHSINYPKGVLAHGINTEATLHSPDRPHDEDVGGIRHDGEAGPHDPGTGRVGISGIPCTAFDSGIPDTPSTTRPCDGTNSPLPDNWNGKASSDGSEGSTGEGRLDDESEGKEEVDPQAT